MRLRLTGAWCYRTLMRYGTFVARNNRAVKRAVKACQPVLEKRLHLDRLIACGAQGCVYETTRDGTVVKVTVGRHDEIDQIMWQKQRGWRSHTALPRVRAVYHLERCAARVGIRSAYATVREDLADIPARRQTRNAVTLLEGLEAALFDTPGTYQHAHRVLHDFTRQNEARLRRIHRDPMAWAIWTHIAHLQVWLSWHGLTMSDVRLSNLGLRVPSLQHGQAYDVVMRDMGFLTLRGAARSRVAARFNRGHARARALGTPPDAPWTTP